MTDSEDSIVEIFCVYAREDQSLQRMLRMHLDNADYQGHLLRWSERQVAPGMDWAQEPDPRVNSAGIMLLLVSVDLLDSHYSQGRELARAFERHQAGELRIIPIILRPVSWLNQPFARLQALPSNASPITSWKNQEEAFLDITRTLQQLLRMRETVRARPMPHVSGQRSARIWGTPLALNPLFTAHDQELRNVFEQLIVSQIVAISGPAGSGKSQLAAEYIYRHSQQYRAILWADASTLENLKASYERQAALLYGRRQPSSKQQDSVRMVKEWLEANKNWLLVLDNLDDPAILFADNVQDQSSIFLPAHSNGHLLVTTRASDLGALKAYRNNPVA